MNNLIKKDFISNWQLVAVMFFYVPFLISIALWAMMDDFGGVAIWFITLLALVLCIASSLIFVLAGEHKKADIFYTSLPIGRVVIVFAKYISSFMMLLISYTLAVFSVWFVSAVSKQSDMSFGTLLDLEGIFTMFIFISIFLNYLLPYLIGFGVSKGFMISFFVTIALAFIKPILTFLESLSSGIVIIDLSSLAELFRSLILYIKDLPEHYRYFTLAGMLIFSSSISLLISIKLFSKRDLD